MPLSRLRLRLGVPFAVAFLVGLLALDLALYGFLHERAERRLTRDLLGRTEALEEAVAQEYRDLPDSGIAAAAREAMHEWTASPGAYFIYDSAGRILASRGPATWVPLLDSIPFDTVTIDRSLPTGHPLRRVGRWHAGPPRFAITAAASAGGVQEDNEALAWWLGLGAVVILGLGLTGGYVLSRRALLPIDELGDAIAAISPEALTHRLPINAPPDELDRVREQFNALLARVERAQSQNRQFLRQAAHQIRTPLTLVLGEASLALSRGETRDAEVLRRIQLAAEQMQRRVDDLFLLAEAQSGSRPALDETVDLEELLLESADVMRGRAHHLGRLLRFGEVLPATVRGNRGLLREAILELIENAIRHGTPEIPIELRLVAGPRVVVVSGGDLFDPAASEGSGEGAHGLGLAIVRWILQLHGGTLTAEHQDGRNAVGFSLART